MNKTKTSILAVVVLAAATLGLYLVRRPRETAPAFLIAGTGNADQAAQSSSPDDAPPETSGKATLRLGTPQRAANQIRVPLHFTAAKGEKVGNIHAELEISASSWVFLDGSAPDGAQWSLTAEKAAPDADSIEKKTSNVINLDIDGNGRSIRNGLVGFLTFRVEGGSKAQGDSTPQGDSKASGDAAAKRVPATIANLETWPPENSSGGDGSGGPDTDKPDELPSGPLNPALGCFFFTH